MLAKEAVNDYLEQVEMQDAAMRERIFDITRGHALCVSIIGDL
jgi:predicted transcriptional regulator